MVVPVVAIAIHIIVVRCLRHVDRPFSPQVHLAKLLFLLNLPLLGGVLCIGWAEARGLGETLLMALFALLVFNGIGYAYFHVFNMSETARRIHMLLWIRDHGAIRGELVAEYSPKHMVHARLARLVEMGQITREADGRYRLRARFLVLAANLVRLFRNILRLPARTG